MQRESLYFTVLFLFGLLLRPALSQSDGGSNGSNASDVFVVIDYDSSGSGSGITPTPDTDSCTLPEDRVFPSTVNGAEQYLRRRALCHAACVANEVTSSTLPINNRQALVGYPVWNVIPDSVLIPPLNSEGLLNCGKFRYNRIVECERGCLVDSSNTQCTSTCRDECLVECGSDCEGVQGRDCSCGPQPPTQPCGLDCRRNRCTSGCNMRSSSNPSYPATAHPDTPPLLSQSDQLPTQYCVNVMPPSGTEIRDHIAALLFRVEDTVLGNYSYYWIRQLKLDLQPFVNREVNVSYAVVTATRGISDYSPPTTVQVTAGNSSLSFPEQLSGFNVSGIEPDERPGFFQHHTIELSWERPDDYDLITSYTVTLINVLGSTSVCGSTTGTIFTAEPNATGLTLQASSRTSPPVSACQYRITVLVNPMRPGDMPARRENLVVPSYQFPTNIIARCPRSFSRALRLYVINFTWSVPFSAAVLSAVNSFRVTASQVDENDRTLPFTFADVTQIVLPNEIFAADISLPPLVRDQANDRYRITVTVIFNPPLRPIDDIFVNCRVDPVPAPPPDPITDLTVTEERFTETYQAREPPRTVIVDVDFRWSVPIVPFGTLRSYDVWFDRTALSLDDNPSLSRPQIMAPATSSRLSATFPTTDLNFTVYLQLRSRSEFDIVSDWTTPIPINVLIFEPPPPDVMTDITISNISYEVVGRPQVRVTGGMLWIAPDVTFGNVTQYHLWISDMPLEPDNMEVNGFRTFQVTRTSFSINQEFPLQSGSADVFIQMRAVSQFNRQGNWSEAFQIRVRLPPPPRNITAAISGVPRVQPIANEMLRVSGEVMFEWSPPDNTTEGGVTRYESRVGLEALDLYENPPMSELNSFEVTNGTGVDPFVVETESIDNLTVVVQMRSSGSGPPVSGRKRRQVSMGNGPWSDPIFLPVVFPPPLPESTLPVILGTTVSITFIILIILLVLLIIVIVVCVRSWLFKRRLEKEPENLVMLGRNSRMPTYIPLAKIEGKEPLLDYWEIPASDVIVEDRLGEGAFGEVFKGTIKGPLRNPKISSVLKHSIGVPIAIKLLKTTASGKEKADFLAEIDMMKKIAEGYNPHIVNMVGCVTLQEPLCLITEFVPYGDLLSFLRSNRKKASRMRRRQKIMHAQVEEQLQLEHVILEQAQVEQTQAELILEQAQMEQAQVEQQGREGQTDGTVEPMQDAAAASTSPAPYLEASNEYSHLTTELREMEVAQQSEPTQDDTPAPYLETRNEYSKLDPKKAEVPEEEEEDAYPDLGDLEANDLIQFAYQIATGMEYLASLNIIHRDLACRNILLAEDKKLKITDFGMSREVEEVYVKKTKGRLPLKWMAIESIVSREFTTASDVWAYGVALWEIGTLGGFPYPTIPNQDLLMMLKQGYRLEKPDNCAPEVYEIMLECWNEDPEDRPSFSQLRTKFGSLILAGKDDLYIDLEVDEMKPYYLIKEEEEKKEGSSTSSGSEESIEEIKGKKQEKEELKGKPSNPYVEAPSQSIPSTAGVRRPQSIVEEEREMGEQTELEESPYADQLPSRPIPRPGNQAALPFIAERPAQNAAISGVPITMLHSDQTSTPVSEPTADGQRTNPYVDDPSTRQSLTASTPIVETNGSLPSLNNVHQEKIAGKQTNGPTAVDMTNI